ncbi:hypothetical protein LSH36_178g03003 [Paralvinella palmiformis]|uniref:Ras association domain-containing protein 1 n=1 Tax=Paralvinella palmiformis TaxID=53620 RepID=A0AAD9JTQ6_9ANNE|nr:hypothetical protein LSH36_178g03003 [Paralvinella palmiformis]
MMNTPSSVWLFKRTASRRNWLLDLWGSRKQPRSTEDDNDSGYHTGSSTLKSRGQKAAKKSPGQWTLTREELRPNYFDVMLLFQQPDTNTFQGFIRVHMNLIRPINMSLSTRPPSIYDVIGQGEDDESGNEDSQITSFYLPKDTTKWGGGVKQPFLMISKRCNTTTQEVIKALLSKFKITDNPRKFALYEKIAEGDKATMRRLEDDEMPLPLCLCWTKDGVSGLDKRKFVLQENDTGEIMWEAFSLPELENFLKILNREEEEYVEQVRGKYRMLKIHMERRSKELCPSETTITDDKRTPVFV